MNAWGAFADVTRHYRWGPHEALALTWSEVRWWRDVALRIQSAQAVALRSAMAGNE